MVKAGAVSDQSIDEENSAAILSLENHQLK
jgi:hypothetical protein